MTEMVTSGLMRGCWRRSDGPLEGDTRPKRGETAGPRTPCTPPRQCSTLLIGGLHPRGGKEGNGGVRGGRADDPEEAAGEAERGEGRAPAASARSDPRGGDMAASGCGGAEPPLPGAPGRG